LQQSGKVLGEVKATKSGELFRPQYHFTPEANWMNDPNGMVYYEGEYHLFYQYYPDDKIWGPMHWGHAVSADLVSWEHLPIGLAPDEHGFIFSGSAVVDWSNSSGLFPEGEFGLVAIFTHHDAHPETGKPRQRQSVAYSTDRGRTWSKYAGNPVLTEESIVDFRDPKVFWHKETERWVMVLAAGDHVRLYTSANLLEWSFASAFGEREGSHDGVWECPDLFELEVEGEPGRKRWVMLVSIGDDPQCPEGSRTQYFVGGFDGRSFASDYSPETILWADYGRDNYAGVSWSDVPETDGRRLFIGWMSNWKYANLTPTPTWRGAMTVPRELSLRAEPEGVRLVQRPADELKRLRDKRSEAAAVRVTPGLPFSEELENGCAELRVDILAGDAKQWELRLRAYSPERAETVIRYDVAAANLSIDRSRSGVTGFHPQFGCLHEAKAELADGRLALHLLLDRCSVELFACDGKVAMTDLIFPDEGIQTIEFAAIGGEAEIVRWEHYMLRPM